MARPWAGSNVRIGLLIGVLMAAFLIAVGLSGTALPFPRQSDYSDAATSHWPNALLFQRALRAGQIPTVNPYIMNGAPFLPNPLNKAFYPFQWAAVILPPTIHLNLLLWLHLTLGGLGMALFMGRWVSRPGLRAFAGLCYAFMPRLVAAAGAGHLDIIYAAAWLPWLLWAVAARPLTVRRALLAGLLASLTFYADIRMYVFIIAAAAIYAGVDAVGAAQPRHGPTGDPFDGRRWLRAVISGGALHAILIAPFLALLARYLPALTRALSLTEAGAFSLDPLSLVTLFIGDQNGAHETMIYGGVGVLALALVALFYRPRRAGPWLAALLAAAIYAVGLNSPVWPVLAQVVPGLLFLRVPARAWLIAGLCLIGLATCGLQALSEAADRRRIRGAAARAALILLGVGLPCAALFFRIDRYSATTSAALIVLTVGLLAFTVRGLAGARNRAGPLLVIGLWAAFMLIDVGALNITLIEGVPQADWLDQYGRVAVALRADSVQPVDHVYSPSYSFPQQAAVYYQLPIVGGVDPFQLRCYVNAVEAATGVRASGYSVTLPALEGDPFTVNRGATLDLAKLAALRVSHVASAFPIEQPGLTLIDTLYGIDNHPLYLYRNTRYTPADAARNVLAEVCPDLEKVTSGGTGS
jgi:hypothetical protein